MIQYPTDYVRLRDIFQAICDIKDFRITTLSQKKDIHAVCYNLSVIGEAAARLSPELKTSAQHIPWALMIGMRNKIVHEYGKIDLGMVQHVLSDELPDLKPHIQQLIEKIKP